jgi:hypothetical protein
MGALGATPASAGPTAIFRPTLELGALLPTATGVRVGADGAEWALPGGARIIAQADAELRIIGKPQRLDLGTRRRVATYTVMLHSGRIRAVIPEGATSAVIVSAPRKASVLVASGEAGVTAGSDVAIANAHGVTSVGTGGRAFRELPPGTVEIVGGGRHQLLDSPPTLVGPSVLLAHDSQVELGGFELAPVSGASAYRVELRDQKTARLIVRKEMQAPSIPAGLARLGPGAYSLRVTSVDASGFESRLPLERPVNVVRLALPAGAFVDAGGAVHFAPGSRLELERIEGVEMRYGHTGDFVAAPASIELLRSEPRLVAFRAGSGLASDLWLVPRKLRAAIVFGSQAPRWPGAPLEIKVRVEDSSPDPTAAADVVPSVSVGVEPVEVEFKADGGWLRGVLPPRPGPGPWVVRVEVKDHRGRELGRDFVEVVAAAH